MKDLNHLIFEDLMDRFKWYPKPFRLSIFCKDIEAINIFEKKINQYSIEWTKRIRREKRRCYQKDNQIIDITYLPKIDGYGVRANAIIFDNNYALDEVFNIILPMANIEPNYGGIVYQRNILEKSLNDHLSWKDYQIDLEDC